MRGFRWNPTAAGIAGLLILGTLGGPGRAGAETALRPPPGSPEWLRQQNELAIRAARQAYWPEAVYRWSKILRYKPDWAAIWNNLAVAMEVMGQWDKAMAYYRRAMELEPENTAYRANYIRFREIQQKYKKGRTSEPAESRLGDPSRPSEEQGPAFVRHEMC